MAWQTPICDRTEQDVQAGADKCYFSAEMLNRIEGNIAFLADLFRVTVHTKIWKSTDFLTVSEWKRILQDLDTVRRAYPTQRSKAEPRTNLREAAQDRQRGPGGVRQQGDGEGA